MTTRREVPNAVGLERELIAACISCGTRALDECGPLTPAEFHDPKHAHVFTALREMAEANEPIEVATLERRLSADRKLGPVGGVSFVLELMGGGSLSSVPYYSRQIRGTAAMRRMMETLGDAIALGYAGHEPDQYIGMVQERVFGVTFRADTETRKPIKALVHEALKRYEARMEAQSELTGVPTGYRDLDTMLCGLQRKEQVIIAGRPSMGKTQLALELAHNTAESGAPTLIMSLEMAGDALADRMLCSAGGLDSQQFRRGAVAADRVRDAAVRVRQLRTLEVDDAPATLGELRTRVRRWRAKTEIKPGVVFVDYLQLIESEGAKRNFNREREVAEFAAGLKTMAKELDVCVVALAQVGRDCEKRDNKRPTMSDLRESGAIEATADVILFVYRDEYYARDKSEEPGVCEVICAKQRNGPIGIVKLRFDETTGRFTDLTKRSEF